MPAQHRGSRQPAAVSATPVQQCCAGCAAAPTHMRLSRSLCVSSDITDQSQHTNMQGHMQAQQPPTNMAWYVTCKSHTAVDPGRRLVACCVATQKENTRAHKETRTVCVCTRQKENPLRQQQPVGSSIFLPSPRQDNLIQPPNTLQAAKPSRNTCQHCCCTTLA